MRPIWTCLPLFLSLRATIRAKVTAGRRVNARLRSNIDQSAREYFALAGKLLAPPAPRLIAVGGLSGTGKSVLARGAPPAPRLIAVGGLSGPGKSLLARALAPDIAPSPGAVVLRSDVERKALLGIAETDPLPDSAYTRQVNARVYATLADKARRVVTAGHSAIVDAVHARAGERAAIAQVAAGVAFHGLFLIAELATPLPRRGGRPRRRPPRAPPG